MRTLLWVNPDQLIDAFLLGATNEAAHEKRTKTRCA